MRDWVHEFARDVIRPAAAEWDEREETPWPIIEEAAKIGLYSLDFFGTQWMDPSGLGTGRRVRGTVLGRRRDRPVAGRLRPGRGRGGQQRHQRADRRVAAADVRQPRRRQARRVLLVRARRRQRRRRHPDPGGLRPGHRRVGAQRHQDLGHQRRHRRRARGRRVGRPGARQPRSGHLHRAAGHAGPFAGPEVPQARHPRVAHGRGRARRRPRSRPLPGRRQGAARRAAGPDRRGRQRRRAGRDEDVRALAPVGGGDGGRGRPGRGRVRDPSTPASGSSSAGRSARTRVLRSRWRTCTRPWTRPGF